MSTKSAGTLGLILGVILLAGMIAAMIGVTSLIASM